MVPVYVSIQKGYEFTIEGKCFSGEFRPEEVGVELEEKGDKVFVNEPFNGTTCGMSAEGLNAINVIVGTAGVHVLGNYEPEFTAKRCCVSCGGTTACCASACITCGSTTVCC